MIFFFLLCEEILQQREFASSPFFPTLLKTNAGYQTQREILNKCIDFKIRDYIVLKHIIPTPIWYTFMSNIIRDKRNQRTIVMQFCNSLYENTVLTIVKSAWNLKYAEIKQILYRFTKPILRDFKSIFSTLFWDVMITKLIDEYV